MVIGAPVVKNVRRASDSTQATHTLAAGVRKRIEFPVDGKQVWRTVTVYDADGSILRQKTYYSNYARITGIVLVGQGPKPASRRRPSRRSRRIPRCSDARTHARAGPGADTSRTLTAVP